MLSRDLLNSLLSYDPETGILVWKGRPSSMFQTQRACSTWNARYAGRVCGVNNKVSATGARANVGVTIFDRKYVAHLVIMAMAGIDVPDGMQVDHIDRDPWNNRWANFRIATAAENTRNRASPKHSRQPWKGVRCGPRGNRWYPRAATASGAKVHLGSFGCPTAAAIAYDKYIISEYRQFAKTNILPNPHSLPCSQLQLQRP